MAKYFKYVLFCLILMVTSQTAWAQFTVTGTVTDQQTGKPLIGANIYNKASARGVSTDENGKFSIKLSGQSAKLRISFVGYNTKRVDVSASDKTVSVALKSTVSNLNEMVVTGLASSTKKENLANDVTKVNADELSGTVSHSTLDGALSGKVPGVNIKSTSGAPGGGFNVQMRGISTLGAGSSQPLYIIDGVYVNNSSISTGRYQATGATGASEDDSGNRLADLNPDDIKSVQVLKGPSAAAIYGERANAGVVIITTKRGTAGKTKVSVKQSVGYTEPLNLLGVASWNEEKIRTFYSDPDVADAQVQAYQEAKLNGNLHDYEKELYDNKGTLSETNISVSGGNSDTQFFVSGGFHTEGGIVKNTGFNRGSIRANLDHNLSDRVHISSSTNLAETDNKRGFTGNQNGSGASLGYALAYTPNYAQLEPDAQGNYPTNTYFDSNPLAIARYAQNQENVTRFIQSVNVNADIYRAGGAVVTLDVRGGIDYLNFNSEVYFPNFLQNEQSSANPGNVIRTKEDDINTNLKGSINYKQALNDFSFTTQGGFTRFGQSQSRQQLQGQGLVPGQDNIKQAKVQSILDQSKQRVVDFGWFGQEKVNWDDKLIGTAGVRADRSSLNYTQDHYYLFPKASLAMNLTNFDFFKNETISQLKLRIAYGETGGEANYGDIFRALNGVNIGNQLGLTVSSRDVDPNLKPERGKELEFGTDIGLWDNRLSLTATYYDKTIDDLILDLPTATSTGITAIATNAASLRNRGIELGLNAIPVQSSSFNWNTHISFWKNDSKVTQLDIPPDVTGGFGAGLGAYLIQQGYSPTTIVGNPAQSGDKSIYKIYGNAQPDFQMSFSDDFNFLQNFKFSFLIHWSHGNNNINLHEYLLDVGGTAPDYNSPAGEHRRSLSPPEAYVQDASFVRLEQIGLHYTVPVSFTKQTFGSALKQIRLGISANNVWLWSDYDGYDPETSTFGTQAVNQSVSVAPYPSSRKILFNITLDL